MQSVFSSLVLWRSVVAVASLLRGQFAWRPVYGGQLSRGQFAVASCRVPGQDVIIWSAVCFSTPHPQDTLEGWKPCPIYALMTERGQLQYEDGSAGPRRVWEAPFKVEGRPHYQKINADEKCPRATQCSSCGPPILLHLCSVRLHL